MTAQIFVIDPGHTDTNVTVNREVALVNYFMSVYPQTVFLCRGTFLLTELFEPRSNQFWADMYLNVLNCCDALYCHEDNRSHPMADYASDVGLAILGDQMDLELFLASAPWGVSPS